MSKELLGNYAIKENLSQDFKLTFEIPDNCSYTASTDNLVNLVTISLNEGEKDPSPDYVKYDLDYNANNDLLTIQFEQQNLDEPINLVFIKKPRIDIQTSINY